MDLSKNYVTIQGRMRTKLKLSGNELMVYAIIYGFSQTEWQKFNGSLAYLAERVGCTKRSIQNFLQNLCNKNLICKQEKFINWVRFVEYGIINDVQDFMGIEKISTGGVEKSSTNNIELYNIENNSITTKENKSNEEINLLIQNLKAICDENGVAYDHTRDRQFAKHILTAKDYGEFCAKIGQNRLEFCANVLIASIKINYWKGPLTWPMKIYQNYSEVYNLTKSKAIKTQSVNLWSL